MHIHDIDVKDFDLVQVQGDVRVTAQVPNGRFVAKEIHTRIVTIHRAGFTMRHMRQLPQGPHQIGAPTNLTKIF